MGAVRCLLNESERCFVQLGDMFQLNLKGTRHLQTTALRYCIQGDTLYLPKGISPDDITFSNRFCWARIRVDEIAELDFDFRFRETLPPDVSLESLDEAGFGLGSRYMRRHREIKGKRVPVSAFCSETLIRAIQKDPEQIAKLSKVDFEALCAELFVSRGFEVDLYRETKDGGIDFLALRTDGTDPILFAVQCKHPDAARGSGKGARTLPVPIVREIYGVAKAHNLSGGIAITSAEYSLDARRFAELKPDEIKVYDRTDVLEWAQKYRWNQDEPA
jgi:hypothetical protein